MYDWRARADEILAAGGYIPGNAWESLLRANLQRSRRPLYLELQAAGDYEAYVVVRTADALDQASLMIEQGTPPDVAREGGLHILNNMYGE